MSERSEALAQQFERVTQLDRSTPIALLGGTTITAERFGNGLLVQSVQEHVDSIRAAP